MIHEYCQKITKKCNKNKGLAIICSNIWHIDTSKFAYWLNWLDAHSVKVWWRYVFPNTNAVHFCEIFSDIHRALFSTCLTKSFEDKKSGLVRITYGIYSKYFKSLHKLAVDVLRMSTTTNRIPKFPTDRFFFIFVWLNLAV